MYQLRFLKLRVLCRIECFFGRNSNYHYIFYAFFSDMAERSQIIRKHILELFFSYVQSASLLGDNCFVLPICYFASFFAHESQYFSKIIASFVTAAASFRKLVNKI